MSKFKTGDRVRLVKIDPDELFLGCDLVAGMVGTVQESNNVEPFVEWDTLTTGHGGVHFNGLGNCWAVSEDDLETFDAGQEPAEDVKVGGTISD